MSDYIARREAAKQRAIDDGRDMWGLSDWREEAYAKEDQRDEALREVAQLSAYLERVKPENWIEDPDWCEIVGYLSPPYLDTSAPTPAPR